MTILIRNSPVHIYKGTLPTYGINEFNPQTMTRVYSYYCIYFTTQKDARVSVYKSHKRNMIKHPQEKCSVNFCAKSKETYYWLKYTKVKTLTLVLKPNIYFSRGKKTNQVIWMS